MNPQLRKQRFRRTIVGAVLAVAVLATGVPMAGAFKPYTHAQTGGSVLIDVEDGDVTILGREYPVRQEVVDALVDWPEFYNAGVIGPDGFPDLTFGQSVIHPDDTGLWLRHIFDSAWAAQDDPSYSDEQQSQVLAFAYGYLMHAAGDTWSHTLVNEVAEGVFPGVGEILTDVDMAAIALRHIIVEGYIGDATPGYDGNDDRTTLPDGDVSDDSTPGVDLPTAGEFGGLKRFIYETLIDPNADTPTDARGPVIRFFLELRGQLSTAVDSWDPDPIETLMGAWEDAKAEFDSTVEVANEIDGLLADWDSCDDPIECGAVAAEIVWWAAKVGVTASIDAISSVAGLMVKAVEAAFETVELALDALFDAYLVAWIDDIDAGLENWAELGRASSVALFDPQARRDLQNEECADEGTEYDQNRISCEDGIGFTDVLFDQADPFINQHLLSMLGLPDAVGGLRQALQDLSDDLDALLAPIGIAFNPIEEATAEVKEFAKDKLKSLIEETIGVDIDLLHSFMTKPASWMDVEAINLDLPILGAVGIELFESDDHEQIDGLLGFEGTDHLEPTEKPWDDFPLAAGVKLKDDAIFTELDAFDNAVTLGKLLLLDGTQLDRVIADQLGRPYTFYGTQPNANIMLTPLPGVGGSDALWLSSIDADHAWRADSQPTFPAGTPSGGEGNFPLWESCALRDDVFRTLFRDWENGEASFPALGDDPSFDPNDPAAPETEVLTDGTTYVAEGTTYLAGDATLEVDASDDFWMPEEIAVRVTVTDAEGTASTATLADGDLVDLSGLPDGPVTVGLQGSDACRTEVAHTETFVLDTTAPVVTVESPDPEGRIFDTDDFSAIGWSSDDGPHGSGVASESATFDGQPAVEGQVLDMFLLDPGTHEIEITAADNLGNSGTTPRTFVVRATAASLASNVQRAFAEGLITKANVRDSLADKLAIAQRSHAKGKHATEHETLEAFVEAIEAQRGKAIDPVTADRFTAYAEDLIANGG